MKTKQILNRRQNLNLEKYDTDKISNNYLEKYDPILKPWVEKEVKLLELGVYKGGSLLLWKDYFVNSNVFGVDINPPLDFTCPDGVKIFKGNQADKSFLSSIANENAPDGFDIIIDDASHVGELTKISFWHLFDNHLKPGGLYVIEDWSTGYWDDWFDGKSLDLNDYNKQKMYDPKAPMKGHSYGMVGFIKQLIDEQGANDVTRKKFRGKTERDSKFEQMIIKPSIVFIKKAK